ncbi:MAG: hypothetical protein RJA49_2857, partial [Actinomycetota bacterium]
LVLLLAIAFLPFRDLRRLRSRGT